MGIIIGSAKENALLFFYFIYRERLLSISYKFTLLIPLIIRHALKSRELLLVLHHHFHQVVSCHGPLIVSHNFINCFFTKTIVFQMRRYAKGLRKNSRVLAMALSAFSSFVPSVICHTRVAYCANFSSLSAFFTSNNAGNTIANVIPWSRWYAAVNSWPMRMCGPVFVARRHQLNHLMPM